MSDQPLDPLPPDVLAALEGERARPVLDLATRARLRERLHATLLAGGSGGHGAAAPQQAPPGAETASASRSSSWLAARAHPLMTATLGFALGVGTGMAIEARLVARTPESLPRPQPVLVAPTTASTDRTVSATPPSAAPVAEARLPSVASAAPTAAPSASSLTAERALLDVAHGALGNGHAADALSALNQHAQRFPRGVYREEREALAIKCLRALGRTGEAERRTAAFRTRYPNSLFLSTVETAQDAKGANR